ncbi:MAG: rhodanese-like domain-containing protein [Frankiaceae bacterium]
MTLLARRGIDEVLADARRRLFRLTPPEALAAQRGGAVLVDIRPERFRDHEGSVPGALIAERNVLEWRFDPSSDARLEIASYDLTVVVVRNEGYTSSLAAAALLDLGISHATDLIGGYRAWRAAGRPKVPGASRNSEVREIAVDVPVGRRWQAS